MAFFFRTKAKSDIVKPTKDLLNRLWQVPKLQKTEEEAAKMLGQMKVLLVGNQDIEAASPEQILNLVNTMIQEDFLYALAHSLHLLPFEGRKDSQTIFCTMLRFRPPGSTAEISPALAYVTDERPEVIIELCRGYNHIESVMPCGVVLREIVKNEDVAQIILCDESQENEPAIRLNMIDENKPASGIGVFWDFFPCIDKAAFEVSADAFSTFREIITKHKSIVPKYLSVNFELFFDRYHNQLIASNSYVTKRQSIKLLGEILLDRANYAVMTAYVDRGKHLKICMNLLRHDRKMVQYESFHVFKVFVANPNKSDEVVRILTQNRDRLLKFLPTFLDDRTEDDQFNDEKAFIIRQIELLPAGA